MNRQIRIIVLFTLLGTAIGAGFTYWMMSEKELSQKSAAQSSLASIEKDSEQQDSSVLSTPISKSLVTPVSESMEDRTSDPDDASEGATIAGGQNSFQELLAGECDIDDRIELSKLPFEFGQTIVDRYELGASVPCQYDIYFESENPEPRAGAYISLTTQIGGRVERNNEVSIGTITANDSGQDEGPLAAYFSGNYLADNYKLILSTEDYEIYMVVIAPGPFGLTSLGVWTNIIGYKPLDNYVVAAEGFDLIPVEGEVRELMLQYRDEDYSVEESLMDEGMPEFTANGRISEFTEAYHQKYFAPFPNTIEPYREMIQSVIRDLEAIELR